MATTLLKEFLDDADPANLRKGKNLYKTFSSHVWKPVIEEDGVFTLSVPSESCGGGYVTVFMGISIGIGTKKHHPRWRVASRFYICQKTIHVAC